MTVFTSNSYSSGLPYLVYSFKVDTVDDMLEDSVLLESLSQSKTTVPPKQIKKGCFVFHLSMNTGESLTKTLIHILFILL